MSTRPYDVAIVGASLAGCTAATLFARRGLRVVLIERHASVDAYKHTCTHFIQPSATATIARLGLAAGMAEAGAVSNALDLWTPWGWIRHPDDRPDNPAPRGYSIRRAKLDPMLRTLAAETAGVDLMLGGEVCGVVATQNGCGGVRVQPRDGRAYEVCARLVVAADGRTSTLARHLGIRARVRPSARRMFFAYYRDLPQRRDGVGQLWLGEPDVAYAYPNDDGVTVLARSVGTDAGGASRHDDERGFARTFAALPGGAQLAGGRRVSPICGPVDTANVSRPAVARGVALIGDAALAADPTWGVGCGWAFQSAEWLVECTAAALLAGDELGAALASYRARRHWELAGHAFIMATQSRRRTFLPHERLLLRAAVSDRLAARRIAEFGERLIGPARMLLGLPRALWIVARAYAALDGIGDRADGADVRAPTRQRA